MKNRTIEVIVLGLLCALVLTLEVMAEGGKLQETCPIMGGEINKDLFVDASGQRIYVCCAGCVSAVKKDPEAALKKLAAKGEYALSLQEQCPVMGGKINKDLFVEYNGRRIYVCCAGCVSAVKKDPASFAKKIATKTDKKTDDHDQ